MPTRAYVDQNFLSKCAGDAVWRSEVVLAAREGRVQLVLSPIHLYELGNLDTDERRDMILALIDEVNPGWELDRSEMLTDELASTWFRFFGDQTSLRFSLVSSEAIASFRRQCREWMRGAPVTQLVRAFTPEKSLAQLRAVFAEQSAVVRKNIQAYQQGRMTKTLMRAVDQKHIASRFAYLEGLIRPEEITARAEHLLQTEPLKTMVKVFIYWGGVTELRTWRIEGYLSELTHKRSGGPGVNSLVDRQHAIVGMSSCDMFVTNDRKLAKRCKQMGTELNIPVASVLSCEDFISFLKLG